MAVNSCSPDGFLIRGEEPNAAMGLRAMGVELVNCGTKTYTLNGYPKVRVLGDKHEALEVNVVNGTTSVKDAGPKPLTLKPGESAQTVLVWRNTATEGVSQEGAYLEITPKTGARTQTIAELIDLGTTGKLELTAWQVRERG